jgi:hypothetical protein
VRSRECREYREYVNVVEAGPRAEVRGPRTSAPFFLTRGMNFPAFTAFTTFTAFTALHGFTVNFQSRYVTVAPSSASSPKVRIGWSVDRL